MNTYFAEIQKAVKSSLKNEHSISEEDLIKETISEIGRGLQTKAGGLTLILNNGDLKEFPKTELILALRNFNK